MKLDKFTTAYLECALWSSTDDDGEPLDDQFEIDDISPECLAQAIEDCKAFQEEHVDLLASLDDEQCGHDFWLTRNRHGAGFWDRGYDFAVSKPLTESSHVYGSVDLYIGDDGMIYS